MFDRFLPRMAEDRSVYAPDLPGQGESDAPAAPGTAADAAAAADLANGLRLRQIDVLGFQRGSEVAVELALARPELVRKLVLIGLPSTNRLAGVAQSCLVMHISDPWADATRRAAALLPHARLMDGTEYAEDLFDAAPGILVDQLGGFLHRSPPAARDLPPAATRKAGTRRG
jgi:pimeloyl-ACP methyl ester carboxylesterase